MRICVVHSSYEGSSSVFTEHESNDVVPNPGYYVDPEHHTFEVRFVKKQTQEEDIDRMIAENFDLYWHFMLYDDVAGIEAVRYFETKNVPLLGSPSDYMAMNKFDLHRAAKMSQAFLVPGNKPENYPKMVKFVDGMGSIGMNATSVCYNSAQVDAKVAELTKVDPSRGIIVEDFIRGIETTVVVVEMGSEVIALPPFDFIFPEGTQSDEAWFSFENKFVNLHHGHIKFQFVDDPTRAAKISEAGVAAFKALGLQGRGAWGRIDARVDYGTGEVYCLELNHYPAMFFGPTNKIGDDILLRERYPGGFEAFADMMIFTKLYQMKYKSCRPADSHHSNGVIMTNGKAHASDQMNGSKDEHAVQNGTSLRSQPIGDLKASGMTIADVYDSCVNTYDAVQATMAIRQWQIDYFRNYQYHGTVLDLACGTGGIGMLIQESGNNATIHGIDVSPLSVQTEQVKKYYSSTSIGLIQEAVMSAGTHDHITCFGALHFLNRTEFNATISKMFMLAQKSVAFDVDDVSSQYNDLIISHFGEGLRNHNHMIAYKRFGTPPGWRKVVEETRSLFYSPSVKIDVPGIVVRFEKVE